MLIFVIGKKYTNDLSPIFDFIDNFDSNFENYRSYVRDIILKARENKQFATPNKGTVTQK